MLSVARSGRRRCDVARGRSRARGDDGSLVLAAVVVLLVGLLGATMFARSADEVRRARRDTERVQALALAERAATEAIDLLDAGEPLPLDASGLVSSVADGTFAYEATGTDERALVRGEGTVDGTTRAVEVELVRTGGLSATPAYPSERYGVFARRSLELSGWGLVTGGAATNGSMVVDGLFSGTAVLAGPDATCIGCWNPRREPDPVGLPPAFVPAEPTQGCPGGNRFGWFVDGGNGRAYVCDEPGTTVRFGAGIVTVLRPPLVVYLGEGVSLDLNLTWLNPFGSSSAVRITKAGDGSVDLENSVVHGMLHLPDSTVDLEGLVTIDGSIMVDVLRTRRFSTLLFLGDNRGLSLPFGVPPVPEPGDWEIVAWRTIAAA
ncbi:MAG: hypothetical protein S0880_25425 [Actinomycetota bacterium]|nr:hypothetical protein [Actinomycetota bacterium]